MDVIIDDPTDFLARNWSSQWQKDRPFNRQRVSMVPHPSGDQVVNVVKHGISIAGSGGNVIFSVGHGATDKSKNPDPTVGMVDLAPHGALRLQRADVFYDYNFDQSGRGHSQKVDDDRSDAELKALSTSSGFSAAMQTSTRSMLQAHIADLHRVVNGAH